MARLILSCTVKHNILGSGIRRVDPRVNCETYTVQISHILLDICWKNKIDNFVPSNIPVLPEWHIQDVLTTKIIAHNLAHY